VTLGYAYATPWKSRSAYRYSSEVTVYVAFGQSGKGIGSRLYTKLLPALEAWLARGSGGHRSTKSS